MATSDVACGVTITLTEPKEGQEPIVERVSRVDIGQASAAATV